jgi:hypothetical protein
MAQPLDAEGQHTPVTVMQAMCSVCRHSQCSRIDQDLRAGWDLRSLSDEFGLRTGSLRHHRDEHVAGLTRGRRSGFSPVPPWKPQGRPW